MLNVIIPSNAIKAGLLFIHRSSELTRPAEILLRPLLSRLSPAARFDHRPDAARPLARDTSKFVERTGLDARTACM
jgi:hypothetical protein